MTTSCFPFSEKTCIVWRKARRGAEKERSGFCSVQLWLRGCLWEGFLGMRCFLFVFPPNYFSYILSLSILECISLCFLPLLGAHALILLCCFFRLMENSSDAQQHGNTLELHDVFMQKKMEKEDGKEGYLMLLLWILELWAFCFLFRGVEGGNPFNQRRKMKLFSDLRAGNVGEGVYCLPLLNCQGFLEREGR